MQDQPTHSRRLSSRIEIPDGVWVCWNYDGREDISRVRDLSIGGLFIETPKRGAVGVKARLNFLVQEGQIRAEAVVRHHQTGRGLGMKFVALSDEDQPHLAALVNRMRGMLRRQG